MQALIAMALILVVGAGIEIGKGHLVGWILLLPAAVFIVIAVAAKRNPLPDPDD